MKHDPVDKWRMKSAGFGATPDWRPTFSGGEACDYRGYVLVVLGRTPKRPGGKVFWAVSGRRSTRTFDASGESWTRARAKRAARKAVDRILGVRP